MIRNVGRIEYEKKSKKEDGGKWKHSKNSK